MNLSLLSSTMRRLVVTGAALAVSAASAQLAVGWGDNRDCQAPPPKIQDAVQIELGAWHAGALRSDGSVVCWGQNWRGMCDVPPGLKAVQIAPGWYNTASFNPAIVEGILTAQVFLTANAPPADRCEVRSDDAELRVPLRPRKRRVIPAHGASVAFEAKTETVVQQRTEPITAECNGVMKSVKLILIP